MQEARSNGGLSYTKQVYNSGVRGYSNPRAFLKIKIKITITILIDLAASKRREVSV